MVMPDYDDYDDFPNPNLATVAPAPTRPHPRLSPDLNPVMSRVLYKKIANPPDPTIYDGIILTYSDELLTTVGGAVVPRRVELAELLPDLPTGEPIGQPRTQVWITNPTFVDVVSPPERNIRVWYLSEGMDLIDCIEIEGERCNSVPDEIQRRLFAGSLWTDDSNPNTKTQMANVAIVLWQEFAHEDHTNKVLESFSYASQVLTDLKPDVLDRYKHLVDGFFQNLSPYLRVERIIGFGSITR